MKALTQSIPNKWYKKIYLVYFPQTTVVTKVKGASLGFISPTENIYTAVKVQAVTHATQIIRKITGINKIVGVP